MRTAFRRSSSRSVFYDVRGACNGGPQGAGFNVLLVGLSPKAFVSLPTAPAPFFESPTCGCFEVQYLTGCGVPAPAFLLPLPWLLRTLLSEVVPEPCGCWLFPNSRSLSLWSPQAADLIPPTGLNDRHGVVAGQQLPPPRALAKPVV